MAAGLVTNSQQVLTSLKDFWVCCVACLFLFQKYNRACAGLRHAIIITTKPRFVVKRACNTEVRLGGENNGDT